MAATTLPPILPDVIELMERAGALMAAEFGRLDGPRFSDPTHRHRPRSNCSLRDRLIALLPARFVGEEAGVLAATANGFCWVVDPHDGTRAFLEGRRGSAVRSLCWIRARRCWAWCMRPPALIAVRHDLLGRGRPITRNGAPVKVDLSRRELTATDVVFLNHGAGQRPVWNGTACAPARFMPLPSIAYRSPGRCWRRHRHVTLRPVNAHDIAAGHALLTAAGGVLLAEDGVPVTYGEEGDSRPFACFGGAPAAVATLLTRTWRGSTEPRRPSKFPLTWPRLAEDRRFDRALGCMLGMVIGDNLGALVEFQTADAILSSLPEGVRDLAVSPVWQTLAGQPTDDSELGLTLARSLVDGPL